MDKIIFAVVIILVFYLINRWLKKHIYHDPENGTFYYHEKLHGDPEINEHKEIINKKN